MSCSTVRRRSRPSSFPFALAASNLALVLRLMLWRSSLARVLPMKASGESGLASRNLVHSRSLPAKDRSRILRRYRS